MYKYIAIDQYDEKVLIREYPRKELMELAGVKSASKIYVDTKDGTFHIGYIVADRWFTVLGLEGYVFGSAA